ncbi:MAG: uroporphyrinogen-III synthase [Myxococcaceae bacterium]
MRPRERAQELCFLLEDEDAEVISLPLLEILPPENAQPLRAAAEQIQRFRWIFLSSPSAVTALHEALREAGTLSRVSLIKFAAVGPGTARAARNVGWQPAAEADIATGAGLYERVKEELEPTDEVLLPAAQEGRRELEDALRGQGLQVTRVAAYRSEGRTLSAEQKESLRCAPPHAVLFGSPRTAEVFLEELGDDARSLLAQAKVIAIGPTTSAALREQAIEVAGVAENPTSSSWIDALARALSR